MRIIQICHENADAYIQDEVKVLSQLFLSWGYRSQLNPESWNADDICLIHYSAHHLSEDLLKHPEDKTVVLFHDYIEEPESVLFSEATREENLKLLALLKALVSRAVLSIGHSERSCQLLEKLEARRIRKVGHFLSDEGLDEADIFTSRMLDDGSVNILCHAPVNPRCGWDHVIKSFFLLEKFENPDSRKYRLILSGDHASYEGWMVKVQDALEQVSLNPELCYITGEVSQETRNALFRKADIFINFDESSLDGYCFVQALKEGLPVITSGQGCGAELLQQSPGVYGEVIHSAIAESMAKLISDSEWRKEYISVQAILLEDLENDEAAFTLRTILSRFE